jgi:ParB family chromosome partitioning protein
MDGGNRGQIVKVCTDPNCRVHHTDRPSPQQLQRDRAQEQKRIEKEKIAITARHRILVAILERVSVPMKKADLLVVGQHMLDTVPYKRIPLLAEPRCKECCRISIVGSKAGLRKINWRVR